MMNAKTKGAATAGNANMPSFEEVMAFFGINPAMGKATQEAQERIEARRKRTAAPIYGPGNGWVIKDFRWVT